MPGMFQKNILTRQPHLISLESSRNAILDRQRSQVLTAFRLHINCGLKAFTLVEADGEAIRRTGPALAIPNIEAK